MAGRSGAATKWLPASAAHWPFTKGHFDHSVAVMSTSPLSPTERTRIHRLPERAGTERRELHEILDAARICHLGVLVDGAPRVIPTGYGRDGDTLYLHGSTGARSLRDADEVCVTVTH